MIRPPLPATTAGLLLALGCAFAAGISVYRFAGNGRSHRRTMISIAAGGLTFQVIHVLEHLLQLSVWMFEPGSKPWLSSWASGTAGGLQYICSLVPIDGTPTSLGVEMLHLTGNVVFLGALTAWQIALQADKTSIFSLTMAERVQIFHVAEHILLVGTLVLFGEALGLSTAFGAASGSTLVALRVWFHFMINAIATTFALRAAVVQKWGPWPDITTQSKLTPA